MCWGGWGQEVARVGRGHCWEMQRLLPGEGGRGAGVTGNQGWGLHLLPHLEVLGLEPVGEKGRGVRATNPFCHGH